MKTSASWTGTPDEYADAMSDAAENDLADRAAATGRLDGFIRADAYEIGQPDQLVASLLTDGAEYLPWPIAEDLDTRRILVEPDTDLAASLQATYEEAAQEAFEARVLTRAMLEIGWVPDPANTNQS